MKPIYEDEFTRKSKELKDKIDKLITDRIVTEAEKAFYDIKFSRVKGQTK